MSTKRAEPVTASALCRWIARRIDGSTPDDLPGVALHASGARPGDGLDGMPRSTVLAHRGSEQRWFHVVVTEFDPERQPPWHDDQDILLTLSHRATAHASRAGRP